MIPNVDVDDAQLDRMLEAVGELWSTVDEVRRFLSPAFRDSEIDRLIELLHTGEPVSVRVNGTMINIRRDSALLGDPANPESVVVDRKWIALTAAYRRWQKAYTAYIETGEPQYAPFFAEQLKAGHEVLVERDPDKGLLAVLWRPAKGGMEIAPRTPAAFVTTVTKTYLPPTDDDDRFMYFDTPDGTVYFMQPESVALHIRVDRPAHRQREDTPA